MAKTGRNDQCPCGSGKKYKRCHGNLAQPPVNLADSTWWEAHKRAKAQAAEMQRLRQQGRGRPIISAESQGVRTVAIRNRVLQSSKWKTFHDFLQTYIKVALGGGSWGNPEIAKPPEERHPIISWYQMVCEHQQKTISEPGKVFTGKMTGAVAAYLHLAYDLYALDHNAELHEKLIARLKDRHNFSGARYEVQVAAMLIRGGFTLEFENESDGSTTHCEFTATSKDTGRKFSVEAKRSEAGAGRVMRQLSRALSKAALHPRVIFIDINVADMPTNAEDPNFLLVARRRIRRYEETDPLGIAMPPAYVFVTNTPWAHHLDKEDMRVSVLGEGFHIPEFKEGVAFSSINQAVAAREAHREMFSFLDSIRQHSEIPSTFDGEIPEFAFGKKNNRLLVGERYEIPNGNGSVTTGVLLSATVNEPEGTAYGVVRLDDGQQVISTFKLSNDEITIWKSNRETFFGVPESNGKTLNHPLEVYDWVLSNARKSTRENLLEFLKPSPDIERLKSLPHEELLKVYAERMAASMLKATSPGAKS